MLSFREHAVYFSALLDWLTILAHRRFSVALRYPDLDRESRKVLWSKVSWLHIYIYELDF